MKPAFISLIQMYPIMLRYGLLDIALELRGTPKPWLKIFNPYAKKYAKQSRGERLRLALQEAGPIYVKFGQMLSTRRDLLPPDLIDELSKLQDSVPPFDSDRAKKIIKKSFGKNVEDLFAAFTDKPIGSASIAQVHGAVLENGDAVVVKILRPSIEKQITQDLSVISLIANLLETVSPTLKILRIHGAIAEFKQITEKELDLNYEAANASQLKRNMNSMDWVLIPKVYWDYTRKNIAVFERIQATPIGDKSALIAQGFDLPLLAKRTVELFFTAVFEHNFFHADMHPGNIFIEKTNDGFKYILVDFGIMGTLHLKDQRYLAENLAAFLNKDYDKVAQLHIDSGWVPRNTRADTFASAIRTVSEPIFAREPHEVSFGELFLRLLETAREFNMAILPQLILLQKTLANVEGLARYLDPHIDIWDTAKPCLETWFKKRNGPKALLKQLRLSVLSAQQLCQLPNLALRALEEIVNKENGSTTQEMLHKIDNDHKKVGRINFITGFLCASLLALVYLFLSH
jgi:ubiquinone biosynthesis protein